MLRDSCSVFSEVLNVQRGGGVYTQAADFWRQVLSCPEEHVSKLRVVSLGAVLFVMLGGRYPFDGKAMPLEASVA